MSRNEHFKRFPSLLDNGRPWVPYFQRSDVDTVWMKEWELACETLVASGITRAEFETIDSCGPPEDVIRRILDAAWRHTCLKRYTKFVLNHPSIVWVPRLIIEDRAAWPYVRRSEDDALSRIERWEELCLKIEISGMTPDAYSETLHEDHRYIQMRNAMRLCYIDKALRQWPYVLASRILDKAKRDEDKAIQLRMKNRLGMTAAEKEAEFAAIDEEYKGHTLYNRLRKENPAWSPNQVLTEIYVLRVLKEEEEKVKEEESRTSSEDARVLLEAKKRLGDAAFEKAVHAKMAELVGSTSG